IHRRLQRQSLRTPGRTEDQCLPAEQQPRHRQKSHHRLETRARDLCRRRQMQPRLHGWSVQRRSAFLPAHPEYRRSRGKGLADQRLCLRRHGEDQTCRRRNAYQQAHRSTYSCNTMTNTNDILESHMIDVEAVRKDFPILSTHVYGYPLVYLDNAATTQKPESVLHAMDDYYHTINSNVHRGVHHLSQQATEAYEGARQKIADFINARHNHEIIYTRGTTESINLVASCFGRKFLKPGDSILISAVEHHSNIVPWQMICEEKGASLKVIPVDDEGELILDNLDKLLDDVKLVSFNYVSNSLGGVNPVQAIITAAHKRGIPVLLDAAQ